MSAFSQRRPGRHRPDRLGRFSGALRSGQEAERPGVERPPRVRAVVVRRQHQQPQRRVARSGAASPPMPGIEMSSTTTSAGCRPAAAGRRHLLGVGHDLDVGARPAASGKPMRTSAWSSTSITRIMRRPLRRRSRPASRGRSRQRGLARACRPQCGAAGRAGRPASPAARAGRAAEWPRRAQSSAGCGRCRRWSGAATGGLAVTAVMRRARHRCGAARRRAPHHPVGRRAPARPQRQALLQPDERQLQRDVT